ncbi:MAG: integrase, partial [Proteobacteria bacterium]
MPGFLELYNRMQRKVIIANQSHSLLNGYASQLAKIGLHFQMLPTEVPLDDLEEYLYAMSKRAVGFSQTYFKFAVYGLRFAYRIEGMHDKYLAMPTVRRDKKLPVVLSKQEMKRMFEVTTNPKHRVLLGLLYGCGLRCFELRHLKIADLDFDREVIH